MTHRLKQIDKLVQLAEMREQIAQRAVAIAAGELAARRRECEELVAAADQLAEDQRQRRETLRNPMIGSAQLRGALDSVLTTFSSDRHREADAAEAVAAAMERRAQAELGLTEARKLMLFAQRTTEKRRKMRQPLIDAMRLADQARDERDLEEVSRAHILRGAR